MEQKITVTPEVLAAFGRSPESKITRLQGGHINDTFLVEDGAKYTLQRINPYVFPSPKNIMENITGSPLSCGKRFCSGAAIPNGKL